MTGLWIDLIRGLKFERPERLFLRSDQQLAMKGAFGGAAIESFFRREPGKVRIVILLRKMRQDKIPRAGVEAFGIGKIFADGVIR